MTGGDWLGLGSLNESAPAAVSGGDWLGLGSDPVYQEAIAQPNDPLSGTKRMTANMLSVGARMLQPFMAPQQVIFGTIGGIEDLATGAGAAKAWDTFTRGTKAALSDVTYGGYQAGGQNGDPRDQAVHGFELFKKAGANDTVAKWGGLVADFLIDVPAIGWVKDVAKAGKLGTGAERVGRLMETTPNLAQSFADPGALQSFAASILKAPMSTAPIRDLVNAVPQGYRQAGAERLGNLIERGRTRASGFDTRPVGTSAAENFVNPTGRVPGVPAVDMGSLRLGGLPNGAGLPDRYAAVEGAAQQVKANIQLRMYDAAKRVSAVGDQVPEALVPTWKTISNKLADAKSPAEIAHWDSELQRLGQQIGPNFHADASNALKRSQMADTYAAENLQNVGLMDPTDYAAYLNGDKRHLRRILTVFENPAQHLDRLAARGTPASVSFDVPTLEGFMGQAKARNPNLPDSPQQMAQDFQAAWMNPNQTPVDALSGFLSARGFTPQDTLDVLTDLGGEWARRAGVSYKADDLATSNSLRRWINENGPSSGGGSPLAQGSSTVPLQQRAELQDYQLEALGELQDHARRITEQGRVVGKVVEKRSIVQGYVDLMRADGVILDDIPGVASAQNTGQWRYVNSSMAGQLGADELSGKYIPAMLHRRLVETTKVAEPGVNQAVFDWTASMWKRAKLASPAGIGRNVASNFVFAERAGVNPLALVQGMMDYTSLIRQANKGDGILDQAARVNGTTMQDLLNHGDFLHGGLMQAEVVERLNGLQRVLANPAGSPFQRTVAGLSEFFAQHAASPALQAAKIAGDVAGFGTGPITAKLSDWYGQTDTLFKGGLFMAMRRKGASNEDAAKFADDTLFNYEHQPYVVDAARKLGLLGLPFASFQLMTTGRFIRNLYENPYSVAKYYRIPDSMRADQSPDQKASEYYGAPGYIQNSLFVPAGRDSKGQSRYFNLASMLPETPVWDLSNSDNVTNYEPPMVQLWRTMISGTGYQGRATYAGGGTLADTLNVNPREAARGALKAAWQFGALPWAPGQPMTERLARSLADSAVPLDMIPDPKVQAAMKALTEGPIAAPLTDTAINPKRPGGAPPQDLADAVLRFIGVTFAAVQPDRSKPGTAQSNLIGGDADLALLDKMEQGEMRAAVSDQQRQAIRTKYQNLRAPITQDQQNRVRAAP